jgi:hypothetical protein
MSWRRLLKTALSLTAIDADRFGGFGLSLFQSNSFDRPFHESSCGTDTTREAADPSTPRSTPTTPWCPHRHRPVRDPPRAALLWRIPIFATDGVTVDQVR